MDIKKEKAVLLKTQGILGKAPRYMDKGFENAEKRSQSHKVCSSITRKSREEMDIRLGEKALMGRLKSIISLEMNRRLWP